MQYIPIIIVLLLFLSFGMISRKIENSIITPPMLFAGAGLLVGIPLFGMTEFKIENQFLKLLFEATLVLVLFSDAARIDLEKLKQDYLIPMRMLIYALPLTIIIGTGIVYSLPIGLTLCEAGLVIAILAPTDAALGQVVVNSPSVPQRLRRALSVESGLNDGLALPIVLVLASIASALSTNQDMQWLTFAVLQLTLGPLAGIAIGLLGAKLLDFADDRNWVSASGQGMIALVLAGLSFVVAESMHGNGFIAAFTAGLVFGNTLKHSCNYLFEFVETEGQLLTQGTFFIFGALFLPHALMVATPYYWLVGILSLTLLRMLPVWIALYGLHLDAPTKLFLGWFGPRGLASILFISLVISDTALPHPEIVINLVFITVFISIFAHGISAAPLANRFGQKVNQTDNPAKPALKYNQ